MLVCLGCHLGTHAGQAVVISNKIADVRMKGILGRCDPSRLPQGALVRLANLGGDVDLGNPVLDRLQHVISDDPRPAVQNQGNVRRPAKLVEATFSLSFSAAESGP